MTDDEIRERPNRIPWPPILYLAALLAAWVLEMIWSTSSLALWADGGAWLRAVGIALLCLGVGLDLGSMLAMHRAHTNVLPHRGAQHLVTTGVFAFSRNPIYLGNTLALAGIALALSLPWLLMTTLLVAVLVDRLAIRREERHLSARFGPAFTDYARRVPRWIGLRRH